MGTETSAAAENTITLKHPIEHAGETITSVTVVRPKGKHFKGIHNLKESSDEQMKLMARLINHPLSVVDEMDFEDIEEIMVKVADFLPDSGLKTTKNAS